MFPARLPLLPRYRLRSLLSVHPREPLHQVDQHQAR